jgi:hypothetical protein
MADVRQPSRHYTPLYGARLTLGEDGDFLSGAGEFLAGHRPQRRSTLPGHDGQKSDPRGHQQGSQNK